MSARSTHPVVASGALAATAVGASPRGTRAMLGIGWRPEVAGVAADRRDLAFAEVVAESIGSCDRPLPLGVVDLLERGVPVFTHGIGLSLGSAERPSPRRLERLAEVAARLRSPLVSEHLAVVRAGGRSAGHLLPVPRTPAMVAVLVENIRIAQDALPVPLAVEPPAALLGWPDDELEEADFVAEVVERSGAGLLLDLANLYVNARNRGRDPVDALDRLPLEQLAYVHVAGGHLRDGTYHDTHAAPVWPEVLDLTRELVARVPDASVMLERDDRFGADADLDAELDQIAAALVHPHERRRDRVAARTRPARAPSGPVEPVDRESLARRQAALVAALVSGSPVPTGFDAGQVALVRWSLLAKRSREVAVRWPATAAALGPDFSTRFHEYAMRRTIGDGGPAADGARFIAGLGRGAGDASAHEEWRRAGIAPPRGRRRW